MQDSQLHSSPGPRAPGRQTIAVTGATGQLGRLVIEKLLTLGAANVIALVRDTAKADDLRKRGVTVRAADYGKPAQLNDALRGVQRLLLISSSAESGRVVEHGNVVAAAQAQGVERIAYTSLLHADRFPCGLGDDHCATEALIKSSGIAYRILRNGWYSENHTSMLRSVVEQGSLYGCAGNGRISSAPRRDFAEAAARSLLGEIATSDVVELAGDTSYTLAELAAEVSRQSGAKISYVDYSEAQYRDHLIEVGCPPTLAARLALWDTSASLGALHHVGGELRGIIGRATTPITETVREALTGAGVLS